MDWRIQTKVQLSAIHFPAIDRYLSAHPEVLDYVPKVDAGLFEPPSLFVESPPPVEAVGLSPPEELKRLVRKFDPVERDFRNRALGKAGEEFGFDEERRKLNAFDRPDLARKVRWVSQEDGDGAGFDILSFDRSGTERLIEVKTTRGAGDALLSHAK